MRNSFFMVLIVIGGILLIDLLLFYGLSKINERREKKWVHATVLDFDATDYGNTYPVQATSDCNGCKICQMVCPTDVITVQSTSSQNRYNLVFEYSQCVQCMVCLTVCPEDVIRLKILN